MRVQPYLLREAILLDVQQIIPLPEAAEFQVQIRQKQRETRAATGSLDRTKYDVATPDGLSQNLSKGRVMLTVSRFLVGAGTPPEEIEGTVGKRLFESVEGQVNGAAVEGIIVGKHPNDRYADRRYFTDDKDLVRYSGKMYALTTQWSKKTMEEAMTKLLARYAELGISYRVAD